MFVFFFFLEFSSFDRKFYFVLSAVYCIRSVNYFCQVYNVVRSLDELGDFLARLYIKINDRDTFFFLSFFRIIDSLRSKILRLKFYYFDLVAPPSFFS